MSRRYFRSILHLVGSKPNGWTELVSRNQDFGNHKKVSENFYIIVFFWKRKFIRLEVFIYKTLSSDWYPKLCIPDIQKINIGILLGASERSIRILYRNCILDVFWVSLFYPQNYLSGVSHFCFLVSRRSFIFLQCSSSYCWL